MHPRLIEIRNQHQQQLRSTGVVVLLPLLLLLNACGDTEPQLPALGDDAVVLAFGDSLTRGTGAKAGQSYPAVLSQLIGREVVNAGVPGELSAAGLARLPAELERVAPALMILCHGGNDMLRKQDLEKARQNLEQMIGLAQARGVAVLLLAAPKPGLWLNAADFYHQAASNSGVPLEADVIAEVLGDAGMKSDPVHPNAAGYRLIAETLAARLRVLGAL